MLKLKRSKKAGWIVYRPEAFQRHHSHFRHKRVAVKVMAAVNRREVPSTQCLEVLVSCWRLSGEREYRRRLEERMKELYECGHIDGAANGQTGIENRK